MRVVVSASVVCLPGLCPRHLFNIEHYSSGMLIGCKEACDCFGVSEAGAGPTFINSRVANIAQRAPLKVSSVLGAAKRKPCDKR
jgi:hypothetical protein